MVFWIKFTQARKKIALLGAIVAATNYIKFSARGRADNGIFMSIVLIAAETITGIWEYLLHLLFINNSFLNLTRKIV